jgi:hypothetical protein
MVRIRFIIFLRLLAIRLNEPSKTMEPASGSNRRLKLVLKLLVTGVCAWYITGKIDWPQAARLLRQANGWHLLPAVSLFVLSKWVSAIRLNIYFRNIELHLSAGDNLRLYWLGMFYNLFLPGAISGDIYKVILLTRNYNKPYKKTATAVILDRFSGLLGLGLLLGILSLFLQLPYALNYLIPWLAILLVPAFYFVLRKFFPDFIPGFYNTLILGLAVQLLQVLAVYMIMLSLGITAPVTAYLFLFLVSSAVSVLPFTIGGLGIRELVFLEGAGFFQLSAEKAVLISLAFYGINLISSLAGGIWVFRNPLNEKGLSDEPLIS